MPFETDLFFLVKILSLSFCARQYTNASASLNGLIFYSKFCSDFNNYTVCTPRGCEINKNDPDLGSGIEKNPDPGSGMNIPDNFSERLETVFTIKNT